MSGPITSAEHAAVHDLYGNAPAPGPQRLSHSRLACFRECPRKHFIRYELGIRRESDDLPRRVGSAYHAALEAYDKGLDVSEAMQSVQLDEFELAMVAAMYDGHVRRYADEDVRRYEVIGSEIEFELPIVNPSTGRSTPLFTLAGKIDRIVKDRFTGELFVKEYKSTSRDFSPGAEYWQRLRMDPQLSLYVIGARESGYPVAGALYDVTRRPMLRPLKATPEEQRKYTQKTGALYANQRAQDETATEFAARVASDIGEKEDQYFARIPIARLDKDLEECMAELWQQQQAIRAAQRENRWWRNPGACFVNNTQCDFLPICMHDNLSETTPLGFIRRSSETPLEPQEAIEV